MRRRAAVVYYVGLIAWVGCHVDAYEQAKWFGDDMALKADARRVDMAGVPARAFVVSHVGAGRGLVERARLGARVRRRWAARRQRDDRESLAGDATSWRLGWDSAQKVRESLYQTFERWDGKGVPAEAKGEEILLPARLVNLADVVEVYHRTGGVDAAVAVARERSGSQFDPALVDVFCADAPLLFSDIDSLTTWPAVIDAEPALEIVLSDDELESALEAIADFTDLKSPWTIGHSRGVADLARAADEDLRAVGRGRQARAQGGAGARPRPPGRLQRDLGQARAAHRGGARTGAPASVPDRADAGVIRGAGLGRRRSRSSTTSASTARGIPVGCPATRSRRRGGSSRRPTPITR